MNRALCCAVVVCLAVALAPQAARASGSCSFDAGTQVLTVTIDGTARMDANPGGSILVDGVTCTGASVDTVDSIQVIGGAQADTLQMYGQFAPGATTESDGASEIEIGFALGAGSDTVMVRISNSADLVVFTAAGIDTGADGDEDVTTAGLEIVKVRGGYGDDDIDASAYTAGGKLYLYGDHGFDTIIGSAQADWLYGGDSPDQIYGGPGNDKIDDGTGADILHGEAGNDRFMMWFISNDGENDAVFGGDGTDTADYGRKAVAVTVTLDDSPNDGRAGEFDNIHSDVENVTGGSADDTIVGSAGNNVLRGGPGNDSLYGGAARDTLWGGDGDDYLDAGGGPDVSYGEAGADWLFDGAGNDILWGGPDNDLLQGAAGTDEFHGEGGDDVIYNDDGIAETVDCGDGIDDPEASSNDTFVACENI